MCKRLPLRTGCTAFRAPEAMVQLRFCQDIAIDRITFGLPADTEDKILPILDRWAEVKHQLVVWALARIAGNASLRLLIEGFGYSGWRVCVLRLLCPLFQDFVEDNRHADGHDDHGHANHYPSCPDTHDVCLCAILIVSALVARMHSLCKVRTSAQLPSTVPT